MDHDAVDKSLRKVERLLDAVQPGWRDERNWPKWERATSGSRPLTRKRRRAISSSTKSRRSATGRRSATTPGRRRAAGEAPQEPAPQETYVDSEGREWRKVAENDWATGGEPDSPDFKSSPALSTS
jgi:hypothetical protein